MRGSGRCSASGWRPASARCSAPSPGRWCCCCWRVALKLLAWLGLAPAVMLAALHGAGPLDRRLRRGLLAGPRHPRRAGPGRRPGRRPPLPARGAAGAARHALRRPGLGPAGRLPPPQRHRRGHRRPRRPARRARPTRKNASSATSSPSSRWPPACRRRACCWSMRRSRMPRPSAPPTATPRIIATRGLLERLERRETQGVVAHLVGSIGSGDLRLAAAVQAVFGTLGAMVLVFDLPFRRDAWVALGDLGPRGARPAAGGAGGAADLRPRRQHLAGLHGVDAQGDEPRRALAACSARFWWRR